MLRFNLSRYCMHIFRRTHYVPTEEVIERRQAGSGPAAQEQLTNIWVCQLREAVGPPFFLFYGYSGFILAPT